MKNDATPYILNSIAIVLSNAVPLIVLLALSLLAILPMMQETPPLAYFAITSIIIIIFYPLVFGQYSDITLNNKQTPYLEIFKKHWFNFIVVNIILNIPSMLIDILRLVLETNTKFIEFFCSVIVTSLAIYVFPLVFIKQKKWQSVKFGIKCFLGNFKFSLPLLTIVVVFALFGLLIGDYKIEPGNYTHTLIYAIYYIVSLFADFIVFVSATLILKEKILTY